MLVSLSVDDVKRGFTPLGCNVKSARQLMLLYQENISMCGGTTRYLKVLLLNVLEIVVSRLV